MRLLMIVSALVLFTGKTRDNAAKRAPHSLRQSVRLYDAQTWSLTVQLCLSETLITRRRTLLYLTREIAYYPLVKQYSQVASLPGYFVSPKESPFLRNAPTQEYGSFRAE